MVVLDDADLDLAVAACLNGAFFSSGQRCTASSRLIVERGVHDAFVARLSAEMSALRVGPALAEQSQIGPVASAPKLQSNLNYVDIARQEGCDVLCGERRAAEQAGRRVFPTARFVPWRIKSNAGGA